MIRELNLNDLVILEGNSKFPIENVMGSFIKRSIIQDGKLVGSIFVKKTTETALIFEGNISPLNRARALKEIFHFLAFELVKQGFNDTHIFLDNLDSYGELLKKHFGFEDVIGKPLVLRKR